MRFPSLMTIALLGACTAADVQPSTPLAGSELAPIWSFEAHAAELRQASCPDGVSFTRAEPLDLQVVEAERGPRDVQKLSLSGMTLAGAWHIKADSGIGGLSGLDVMRSGSLLSIADNGSFVWIGIDPETGAPDGTGSKAEMLNASGQPWPGKLDADSEGLAFRDGLAFVSFERDHRIEAYDLEGCGAAARAARVATLDKVVDRGVLLGNRGAEALALVGDDLVLGFERHESGGSPMGALRVDGTLTAIERTRQPILYLMTGMDVADGISARLFRAYDPARGARGIIQVNVEGQSRAEAKLKSPLPVDNYEGIAIGQSPQGTPRIWVISDDNFSKSQRTLLLALDLDSAS